MRSATRPDGRRGMELVRVLNAEERALLTSAYEANAAKMPRGVPEIHWLNLYLNRAFTVENPLRDPLHAWVTRTVKEVYADWPEVHILSYGFITNPAGSTAGQLFHCDYTPTSSNLFVPMTPVTLLNATQFVRRPLERAKMNDIDMIGTIEEIMDAEGLDAIEVSQLVCRPFCLVKLGQDTPHRGVPNRDTYDRLMLWVTVDDHYHPLKEKVAFKFIEDQEAFSHWQELDLSTRPGE